MATSFTIDTLQKEMDSIAIRKPTLVYIILDEKVLKGHSFSSLCL